MKTVWAAAWINERPEILQVLREELTSAHRSNYAVRLLLFFEASESDGVSCIPCFQELIPGIEIQTQTVRAYPQARLVEQNNWHPDYPDTVLAPYASASKRLEKCCEKWLQSGLAPARLLVPVSSGLPYFVFHRAWRDEAFLEETDLVLIEDNSISGALLSGSPRYGEQTYWMSRMATFCRQAATRVIKIENGGKTSDKESKSRDTSRIFPMEEGKLPMCVSEVTSADRLSVIIPYYNMGKWLDEAVDSVINADSFPIELIIVDDGTDCVESLEALRRQTQKAPWIRIISQENRGLGLARIRGVEEAQGDIVFFLDADDSVDARFFGEGMSLLWRFSNISMVTAWEQYFGEVSKVWPKWDGDLPWMLGKNMTTPMVMVRRTAWLNCVRWQSDFANNYEDYDAWLSLMESGHRLFCIPEVRLYHRIRKDSRWERRSSLELLQLKAALLRHHRRLYATYANDLIGLLVANGPAMDWDTPGAFHSGSQRSRATTG
jgi:GT2 family glycosyltransferase